MDTRLIQSVNREIYRRFPELDGCTPRVTPYRAVQTRSPRPRFGLRLGARPPAYLLVYHGRRVTSTGKATPYIVRVVVEENGKIVKTTLSH